MPNHIQNKLQVIGDSGEVQKLFNHIKGKSADETEVQIDFNKIKPMPDGMNIEIHSGVKMWAEICTGQIDFSSLFHPLESSASKLFTEGKYGALASRLGASTAMEYLTGKRKGSVRDFSEEEFNAFIQCLKNIREHGSTSWYEWSLENWGTKWNAYDQNDKRNTSDAIYFKTAWSSPVELIRILSEQFPNVTIQLEYADEDSGSNTGMVATKAGGIISQIEFESQSKEGFDMYFELHPESRSNYEFVNGKYEYVGED